ncbi:TPA: hypothetical protein ACJJS4_002042, partial [Neisseria meningitidis]
KTAENLCWGFGCREGKEFCKGLKQKQKPKVPSFPRRRESRPPTRQESIGNNRNRTNLDSRFRGNDGGKVAVFPINSCRSSFLGWREIKQKRTYQKITMQRTVLAILRFAP